MAFDPATAYLADNEPPSKTGLPPKQKFDPSTAVLDEDADLGLGGTLIEGAKSAGRAISATVNAYAGDNQGIVDKAQAQQEAPKDYRLDKFYGDFADRTAALGDAPGVLETIGAGAGAIWDNPAGAGLAVVEQLPNAVPALAGGFAGMKAGAAGGAALGTVVAPGPGTVVGGAVGGVVGGLAGMFIGNTAIETGHKAMGMADDGAVTDAERSQAISEGAIKGGVITGVDALTLGAGGKLASALQRTTSSAMESATRKVLLDRGVDVADNAAVLAARSNPEIATAVRAAQESARQVTDKFGKRLAVGGTLLGMETVGEGVGEYLGELAATGEGNVPDAVLESLLSLGQSGAETAWNMARKSPSQGLWVQPQPSASNPAPAPIAAPNPDDGVLSRSVLAALPAPAPRLGLPAPESVLYADGQGTVSDQGPARNVDREYRPTGRERDPRTFGAGMDQQTERGAVPGREGDYIPVSRFASQQVLASNTIDGQLAPEPRGLPAPQRLLADGRADAGFIETNAAGESRQAKTANVPPKDYVPQGGRGMDQQTPAGKKYTGMPAARKALRESANPAAMEVVKVGKKLFEVRAKPVDGGASEPVTAPSAIQFAAGQRWQHQGRTYNVNKVQADGRASVSTPSGSQAFVIRPEQAAAEGWTQDAESNGSPLSANGSPVTAQPAQKKARKVDRERDSVAHAVIRLGGITTDYRQDTTGEAKGNTNIPGVGSLWSDKTGTSIDDMASLLDQHGYIPQGEMASDGGVSWLQAALGDQLAGRKEHFAPGSKRQEEQALKTEANRLEVQAAQEEAGGNFDSAETIVSDLLDDADLLEIRAAAATKHAAELDVIFGDSPNETVASTQSADRPTEGAQRTEAGESGSAGAGQRPQGSQPDARAESPAEETPSLELTTQTEASAAADAAAQTASDKATAAAQKKADDAKKKADNLAAIKAANTKASETFELGQNADDNLSGQSGMFDSAPSLSDPGSKPATKPAKAKTKIEDAGDQLKFNKKGMFRNGGLKWSDIKDDNEAMKVKLSAKEKIWARPDWEEIIAAQPESVRDGFALVAHLVKQVYDGIPKQSPGKSDEALQTYIAAVGELRDAAEALLSDNAKVKPLVAALAAKAARRLGTGGSLSIIDMIKGDADSAQPLFSALFPEQASGTRFARGTPANDKANALDKAVKKMQWGADSAVEAMKAIKKGWPAKQEAWQKQGYAVFDNSANEVKASHYEGGSGVSTTLKLGSSTIEWLDKHAELGVAKQAAAARLEQLNGKHLVMNKRKNILGAFDTNEEAEDFARKQTARKKVEADSEANEADENWWSRAGDERRPGNSNVTEGEFKEAFGFRGVNFGKWVNQQERQQHLNAAFDAFHDLAAVLDIPPKAISLNGMLGMAFGAQGGGSAAAHFVAGVNEINLTKTAGAGALAHEWAHGLDHYFGVKAGLGRDGAPWASTLGSRRQLPEGVEIRPEVAQAFKSVIAQMRAIEETPEQAAQAARTRLDRAKIDIAMTTQPMREQLAGNAEALAALDKVVAGDIGEYVTLPPAKGKRKPVGAVAANIKIVFDALGYSNEKMAADGSSLMGVYFAKPEVGGVVRSRIKHTDFYKKSQARDGKSGNYWATQWEMFARGFESWVMDKLAGQDKHNNYLVRPGKNDRGVTDENFPYPAGEERKAFNQAIDVLTAELKASAPDESGNVALFSRSATGATLTTLGRGDVEQITARLVTEAAVARRFVFSSWEELPQAIKDRAAAQGAKPGEIKAVHWQGKTYLVDRRFTDAADVERTIFHEYYAHYGLRQQYGKDLHRKLLRTWAKVGGTKGVRAMAAAQGFNIDHYIEGAKQDKELAEAQRRVLVMDELLAHMAESTGSLKRLIQEWYGAVRDWLRSNGWAELAKLDAADLAFILRGARQAAKRADGGAVRGQPLFQRAEAAKQTATAAFKNWFGDSKVVDANGEPLVVYHGTARDFDAFTQGAQGDNFGDYEGAFPRDGFWFTDSPSNAAWYAHVSANGLEGERAGGGQRSMPVYLSISNPYRYTAEMFAEEGEAGIPSQFDLESQGYDGLIVELTSDEEIATPEADAMWSENTPIHGAPINWPAGLRAEYEALLDVPPVVRHTHYVAFKPEQIKSATGNNGDFDPANPDIRFKRAAGIATAAFKRWFGASKVVNNQGEPKILYHGTGEDFTVFDQGRSGSSTRHSTAPLGIFMTGDRDTAQAYADKASDGIPGYARVMQLYAAIRNPYMMTVAESLAIESPGEAVTLRAKLEREGYDGISLEGTDTWVAFSNTQVKSATDNNGEFDEWSGDIRFRRSARDLFDRATGPAPLDRNDPFAAENRRLREDDKTLWAKAKKVFARQFAPGGLLPEAVFNEKITRDSEFQAVEFDVRHLSGGLNAAVKADFGVDLDNLTAEQMKPLAEALSGKVDPAIPEATRVAIVAMRQYIDSLSGEYLDILQKQVEANIQGADQALIEKITGNLGAYVNRSYQAFDDPNWFKTVPTDVVNTARTYLAKGYIGQGETPAEAARLADVTVNEMLKTGTAYDSMGAFIAEGKLGAKDLTVLIKRKEIAPEIRALLGEYMDPRLNFAKSATKMGRLVWNQRFLDRVLSFGMGTFLFEGKNRPADATTQIAGEKSETYAPLNGLWTFPEVAQAFQDALGKEQMSDLYRTVVRLNGMVKYGKTILSPTTAMRNWQSAMFFSLANGHFDLTQMKHSWAAMREQVTQNATGDDLAYLRKLKQLGVVYDTPYAGEMMALLQDARMDELLSSKSGTGLKWLRKANQFAQGFYSFGDDFWKIIGYENEKASLIAAGIVEAEAETMAAKRIRDTYPTYSMIGKAIQWLRRFPLVGTFVSFPSEIIRTTVNMMKLTAADLKSDNPKIQALGRKRAAGMTMVSAGFYALSAMTAAALGVGDDEEEALRDLSAPWSKNSTFLYTGRDADGKLRYFDMSFLDPYGYWKRPLTAMLRDQPWEDAAVSGLSDMLSPFFGADITAGAIFEVLANKKPTGGQVYNEHAGSVDQLQDISNHMRKALQPGFFSNAERLWKAGNSARHEGSGQPYDMRDEVVSLLGWRAATLDTQTGLYYRSFDFTDALTDAKKTLTRTLRSSNDVSEGDIQESKQAANAQYQKAFTEMGRLVSSAEAAGMSRREVMQTLKLSGVAQRNIVALLNGRVPEMDIGMQAQAKAVKQAGVMRDSEHAAEIARRFRLAREQ